MAVAITLRTTIAASRLLARAKTVLANATHVLIAPIAFTVTFMHIRE